MIWRNIEGVLFCWYVLAFGAVYFAVADLWQRGFRFSPSFLVATMLAGFMLLMFREAQLNRLRDQVRRLARERDALKEAQR